MRLRTGVVVGMAVGLLACSSNSDNGGGGNTDVSDFQQDFSFALENNLAGFGTSMQHLIAAVGGTSESDVTLTPISNGVQASVGVDVDGDGTEETTVNGSLVYLNAGQGLSGGATLTLSSIEGGAPQSASGAGTITQTGPAVLTVSNGHFNTSTQTQDHSLSISQANLTLDASGALPVITGSAHFNFDGISGTMTFLPASATGFKVQISGSGFSTFTVPCATEICSD